MHIVTIKTRQCDRIKGVLDDLRRSDGPVNELVIGDDGLLAKGGMHCRRDCLWVEAQFDETERSDSARAWIGPSGSHHVDSTTWNNRRLTDGEAELLHAAAKIAKSMSQGYLELQARFFDELLPELVGKTREQAIEMIEAYAA